jgi:uncharacterized protein YfaS (alpha-2-macroglobulin family)
MLRSELIPVSRGQRLVHVPVTARDRGNISVSATFVRLGRVAVRTAVIHVPHDDRRLTVSLETFRDRIRPGEDESWSLRVADNGGDGLAAEVVASMYDASLDQFQPHAWDFRPAPIRALGPRWRFGSGWGTESARVDGSQWRLRTSYVSRTYEQLNWFGLDFASHVAQPELMHFARAGADVETDQVVPGLSDSPPTNGGPADAVPQPEGREGEPSTLRRDLRETAFFLPQLRTGEDGRVRIQFSAPEALTRWRFLALAHTPDVRFGQMEAEVTTRKEIMVAPNVPRFVRERDQATVTARVSNVTEKDLEVQVSMEYLNAETGGPIDAVDGGQKVVVVAAGGTRAVSWRLAVPEGVSGVTLSVRAESDRHSDGEQHTIPVLADQVSVTESVALPVRGPGAFSYRFDRLSDHRTETLRHQSVMIEFAANPAWLAVQALPYLLPEQSACSEQVFSRLYANAIGRVIAEANPRIDDVFRQWHEAGARMSRLEQSDALSASSLGESPWLDDARREAERRSRLRMLFDDSTATADLASAVRELRELQDDRGGWPWFAGMAPNRYITQHIVGGLGRLRSLGVSPPLAEDESMLREAVWYIDEMIRQDYDRLVRSAVGAMNDDHLGPLQAHYLFVRSFFGDIEVAAEHREAYRYFNRQLAEHWVGKSPQVRAHSALALSRGGQNEVARSVLRSLRESAVTSEELGSYWKVGTGYEWYRAPIESHVAIMEAFHEIDGEEEWMDSMQLWLLKQKQTQDWRSTKATADAVYAILMRGTRLIDQPGSVSVRAGSVLVPDAQDTLEAGTGYFRRVVPAPEVDGALSEIEVTKEGPGPAWGAVYWTYLESPERVEATGGALSLERAMLLQRVAERGPVLVSIDSAATLRPGDIVRIRITLRSDRDMEFVHLQDRRAAGLEPIATLSGYRFQDGLGYYEITRDTSTEFFIDYLPRGTYVLEYSLRVNLEGDYSAGLAMAESMYAPEFRSYSSGARLSIGD